MKSLLFIDSSVQDVNLLLSKLHSNIEAYILESGQDGVAQITQKIQTLHLEGLSSFSSLYLVTHGSPGSLCLGNTELSLSTLDIYTQALKSWFSASPKAELHLYACNVAAGDAGEEFVRKLNEITGAKISASTTKIGNEALGGNWELDVVSHLSVLRSLSSQTSPFSRKSLAAYPGVLAPNSSGNQDNSISWIDFNFISLIGSNYDSNTDGYGVIGTFDLGVINANLAGTTVQISTSTTEPNDARLTLGGAQGIFSGGESTLTLDFSNPVDFRRETSPSVAFGPGEIETIVWKLEKFLNFRPMLMEMEMALQIPSILTMTTTVSSTKLKTLISSTSILLPISREVWTSALKKQTPLDLLSVMMAPSYI